MIFACLALAFTRSLSDATWKMNKNETHLFLLLLTDESVLIWGDEAFS